MDKLLYWRPSTPLAILMATFLLKLYLVDLYRSTDFEVHRHWMALTSQLGMSEWYINTSSQWTLDYPPLFAYLEYLISMVARPLVYIDPSIFQLSIIDNNYSDTLVYFQRLSVIILDIVLYFAVCKYSRVHGRFETNPGTPSNLPEYLSVKTVLLVLTLANPGLLIVDHIHFQYNGFLLGIYIYAIAFIQEGNDLAGAVSFSILLNFKHIFAYVAPVFFFYLLSNYCFKFHERPFQDQKTFLNSHFRKWSTLRFLKLGTVVAVVFGLVWGPFIYFGQLKQIASRLFPFKRGLTHSYWAPNVWALYNFADKVMLYAAKAFFSNSCLDNLSQSSLTRGLVEDAHHLLLPTITPTITGCLTLIAMSPVLFHVFQHPYPSTFLSAVNYCAMCCFMLGWHVHEKAALMMIIPLGLSVTDSKFHFNFYYFFSVVGHYSLFPLLYERQETIVKATLLLFHILMMEIVVSAELENALLRRRILSSTKWKPHEIMGRIYLCGFILVELFTSILQPLILPSWEFLPLMVTSVYCSVGMLGSWFMFWKAYTLALELEISRRSSSS